MDDVKVEQRHRDAIEGHIRRTFISPSRVEEEDLCATLARFEAEHLAAANARADKLDEECKRAWEAHSISFKQAMENGDAAMQNLARADVLAEAMVAIGLVGGSDHLDYPTDLRAEIARRGGLTIPGDAK